MLCGAAVFSAIELPGERRAKQRWEERLQNFTRRHNLSRAELRDFLREYEEASVAGIRVDDIRPRWDFTGAFYFVGTVVSTIGEYRRAASPRRVAVRVGRGGRRPLLGARCWCRPTGACVALLRQRTERGRAEELRGGGGMGEREDAEEGSAAVEGAGCSARGLSAEGLRAGGGLRGYRRGKRGCRFLLTAFPIQICFPPHKKRSEGWQQFFQQSLLPRAPWLQAGRLTLRTVGERWPGQVLQLGTARGSAQPSSAPGSLSWR